MWIVCISILSIISSPIRCAPIELLSDNESPPYLIEDHTPILILSQSQNSSPDGSFSYSFETGNQIKQQVNGYHKTVFVPRIHDDGTKSTDEHDTADVIVQSGEYSYVSPEGSIISVSYIADENGFHAMGDALPTSPPIPETILRSLQYYPSNTEHLNVRGADETENEEQHQQKQQPPSHLLAASQDNVIILTSGKADNDNNNKAFRKQRSSPFSS